MSFQHIVSGIFILQLANCLGRFIGCGHHQQIAIGKEPNVPIIFDDLYGSIELILKTIFAIAKVAGFADVATIEMYTVPIEEHLAP